MKMRGAIKFALHRTGSVCVRLHMCICMNACSYCSASLPFSAYYAPFVHIVMLLSFIIRNSICLNGTGAPEGLLDDMSSQTV